MGQLDQVNTDDIGAAIRLGCRTMQSVFNADDGYVPFFGSCAYPEPALSFSSCHSEAHVPGRHLNALLNAEDAAGVALDEAAIDHHRRAALLSYSGPVALPLNRQQIGGRPVNFCPHNLREGFHALYALARFRDDGEARDLAERSIAAVFSLWRPEGGWDTDRLAALGLQYQPCQGFLHGEARMLGPLVKLFRATGSSAALELALVVRDKLVEECFWPDGAFAPQRFETSHVHSITCVLSSLAQLADLMGDAALMARVRAFYDHGLWAMRDELGWSPESLRPANGDRGEANNTGDILETALLLGRHGYPDSFHDAERILRGHLLPSQLRDIGFIPAAVADGTDGKREVADRHRGAFGFPAPYGHAPAGTEGGGRICFNMDIVGGAVGSLCEAWREAARTDRTGHWVQLLFDCQTPALSVGSAYRHGALSVELRAPGPLHLRLPPWLDGGSVQVSGTEETPRVAGGYLRLARPPVGRPVGFHFALPERELTLSGRVHPRPIRVRLRGDAVMAMDNLGADWTYFPPLA